MCHELSWQHALCGHLTEDDPSLIKCEKVIKAENKCENIEEMIIPACGACDKCTDDPNYVTEENGLEVVKEEVEDEVSISKEKKRETEEKIELGTTPKEEKKTEKDEGAVEDPEQSIPKHAPGKNEEDSEKLAELVTQPIEEKKEVETDEGIWGGSQLDTPEQKSGDIKDEAGVSKENDGGAEKKADHITLPIEEKNVETSEGIHGESHPATPEETPKKDKDEGVKTEKKQPFVPSERIKYRPRNNAPGTSKVEALRKAFESGLILSHRPSGRA